MERLDVSEGDLARFYPIGTIRQMITEGTVSNNDIIDMAGYNANLFAYTMIQLPTDIPTLSPMQEQIFDTFYDPVKNYKELLLICGRKSGKSMLCTILLLFEVYKMLVHIKNPQEYYGLARNKKIMFQLLGSNRDQAQQVSFDYIRSFATSSPYLRDKIKNQTNESLEFENNLVAQVYNCSARSARGQSSAIVLMDEICHWIFERSNLSSDEVYKAVTPNTQILKHMGKQADSKVVLLSSPAGRQGIGWDLFKSGVPEYVLQPTLEHGEHTWRCVFQVPSWIMNPKNTFNCKGCPDVGNNEKCKSCLSFDMYKYWIQDKDNFDMEYGALFCDVVNAALPKEMIRACINNKIFTSVEMEEKSIPRVISLDPGLKHDAYALVMGHLDVPTNMIIVDLIKHWMPLDRDHPIDIKAVERYVENLWRKFYVTHIVLDQYQSASTVQTFQQKGMPAYCIPTSSKTNLESYERLINRINTQTIRYPQYDTLINELDFLQRKVMGKTVRYEAAINSTDDITDALAKMVYVLEKERPIKLTVDKLQ